MNATMLRKKRGRNEAEKEIKHLATEGGREGWGDGGRERTCNRSLEGKLFTRCAYCVKQGAGTTNANYSLKVKYGAGFDDHGDDGKLVITLKLSTGKKIYVYQHKNSSINYTGSFTLSHFSIINYVYFVRP
ncbi:hypothetical protein EGW08_011802 [Elysia chlorotica]|uniref:Uncharacterized protein n=1 Tax=Elysia chlorotica TaxID=188477 RepID=A0A433TFS0_ELYCH|nr:hypothetical protein EGW08_011802 [Elysia chlorotica]